MSDIPMKQTPLYSVHVALGARMVPFAGYAMPVQYEGVLAEHRWTRESAGLFDVSHMGQARLRGAHPYKSFEALTPSDVSGLKVGRQRYSLLLAADGGILDDLMMSRPDDDGLFLVVNAGCKDADFALIRAELGHETELEVLENRALLALQGPKAAAVLEAFAPGVAEMAFMDCGHFEILGSDCIVSRSGYTGEDGYEISVPNADAEHVWDTLLTDPRVKAIGLGARDSLRLEAGLPLYGHDVDPTISLAEANLGFALSKRRRDDADYRGAARVAAEIEGQARRIRVGIRAHDGAPAREGAEIADADGTVIGVVTSGGPAPSLGYNIAMGYVPLSHAAVGTPLKLIVRGKANAAEVVAMPFHPSRYYRKPKA